MCVCVCVYVYVYVCATGSLCQFEGWPTIFLHLISFIRSQFGGLTPVCVHVKVAKVSCCRMRAGAPVS